MSNISKIQIFILILISITLGCKETNLDALSNAQMCLNSSPAANAENCVSGLSADNSALANSLKCSAVFISEGYGSPSSLINALNQISNSSGTCSGGCSTSVDAMATLNFRSGDLSQGTIRNNNISKATRAFNYCSNSGTLIYSQISSLFKIGTDLAMNAYVASGTITSDSVKSSLSSLDNTSLGNVVLTTYTTACSGNSNSQSSSTKQYCTELQTALGSYTTASDVGACLKIKLANPSAACP